MAGGWFVDGTGVSFPSMPNLISINACPPAGTRLGNGRKNGLGTMKPKFLAFALRVILRIFAVAALCLPVFASAGAEPSPGVEVAASPARYYTPKRGSSERRAIMEAARQPISAEIGQTVIFVVDELRSDGHVAYLQAVPHQPDGAPLDWTQTRFREDWNSDFMSDVVMVLLSRVGERWLVVDYVIGPTDVHWIGWIEQYGLPEALFHSGG